MIEASGRVRPRGTEQYSVAKGYVQSAYSMLANPHRLQLPDDTSFYPAFGLLAGFALELYLKSFLVHKGYEEQRLRQRDIGHNVSKLHEMCRSEGLHSNETEWLIKYFGEHHKDFAFRYLKLTSEFEVADLFTTFAAFSSLDRAVDTAIGASVSMGLKPAGNWVFPSDGAWRFPKG